jgi:ketosteroid isomerase-like protein
MSDSGLDFTFQGTFNSATDASGTLAYQGKHEFCGTVPPTQVKWSAKKEGGSMSSPSPAAKAPTPSSGSASKTLRAFFDAINAKNVDAALALVDDTITFNIASTPGMGKAALKTYLQGQITRGVTYTLGDLDDQGDTVDFSLKTGSGAMKDGNTASFNDDNKIDFLIIR